MTIFVTTASKPSYASALRSMFEASTPPHSLKIAVAFWGIHMAELLLNAVSKNGVDQCQFICNLESGATNPDLIQKLFDRKVAIKTNPTLHAKVVLTRLECLTGSANLSANGLGVENKNAFWEEAGILTNDPAVHVTAEEWFDALFVHPLTQPVTQADIDMARKRRSANPPTTTPSQTQFPMETLESWLDRKNIWLTLWDIDQHEPSEIAVQSNEKERALTGLSTLNFFEEWPALQTQDRLIFDLAVGNKISTSFWRRHHDLIDEKSLCFVRMAAEIDCPEQLRNAWQKLISTHIDPRKLKTFLQTASPNERLIENSTQLKKLLLEVAPSETISIDRLAELLNFRSKTGGLIYLKRGSEGKPLNFKIDGSRGVSGFWRNHLTTRRVEWIVVYHRLGASYGDVWIGEPDGTRGEAPNYEIVLKNLTGPYRVQKNFEGLTGKKPPENPIYASSKNPSS